jgi:hypothetical protein
MNRTHLFASCFLVGATLATSSCSSTNAAPPRTAISAADAAATGAPVVGMAHGNHNPKYGGVVLMNGDLHLEVVAKEDGNYTVYFSDAARQELPASVVSDLKIGIKRPGFRTEPVDMKISDSGDSWEGKGGFVDNHDTMLGVTFMFHGKECTSDMPFFAAEDMKLIKK